MGINDLINKHKVGFFASLLGSLIFFITSFYGHNYIWEGNGILSFIFSLFTTILLFSLSLGLLIIKSNPGRRNGINTVEIVLITLYSLIAIASSLFVMHFINVEFSYKDDIRQVGKAKLETIIDLRKSYQQQVIQKIDLDKTECDIAVRRYLQSNRRSHQENLESRYQMNVDRYSDKKTLYANCINLRIADSIKLLSVLEELEVATINDKNDYEQIINNFSRRRIPFVMKDLDDWYNREYSVLSSTFSEFTYQPVQNTGSPQLNNLKESLSNPKNKYAVTILFVLLIHMLIIGWYVFSSKNEIGKFLDDKDKY